MRRPPRGAGTTGPDRIEAVAAVLFNLLLMSLVLLWSGHFAYRLAATIPTALRDGRYVLTDPKRRRRITMARNPIEFWFSVLVWSILFVFFSAIFCAAGYALVRAVAGAA